MEKIGRLLAVTLVFVIPISFIFSFNRFYQYCEKYQYYSGILGSLFAAFFAAFLVWVAWQQLSSLRKTSSADFLHRLKKDFFTEKTRTLISLIDCEVLEFIESRSDTDNDTYFKINQSKLKETNLPKEVQRRLNKRKYYSTEEVDDLLLGHFEDIGMLEQRGIIDFQMVYDMFSWYLATVWNDKHVKNYLRSQRIDIGKNGRIETVIYSQFQYIAIKCREYEDLRPGPCLWWWKFKRFFCRPKIEIKI